MDGPKGGGGGGGGGASWWATLPGVLTGLAAVLTAIGGLIAALTQVLPLLSSPDRNRAPPPARSDGARPPTPSPAAPSRVGDVGVAVVSTRRTEGRGATAVELHYRVSTGAEPFAHDPEGFVKLMAGEKAFTPIPTPAARTTLPPRAVQDVLVRFVVPGADAALPFRFRFGEGHPIDLPPRWPD